LSTQSSGACRAGRQGGPDGPRTTPFRKSGYPVQSYLRIDGGRASAALAPPKSSRTAARRGEYREPRNRIVPKWLKSHETAKPAAFVSGPNRGKAQQKMQLRASFRLDFASFRRRLPLVPRAGEEPAPGRRPGGGRRSRPDEGSRRKAPLVDKALTRRPLSRKGRRENGGVLLLSHRRQRGRSLRHRGFQVIVDLVEEAFG
jgi:hypothetical protein